MEYFSTNKIFVICFSQGLHCTVHYMCVPTLASSPGRLGEGRKNGLVYTECACVKVYRKSWYIVNLSVNGSVYDYVMHNCCTVANNSVSTGA